VLGGTTIHAWLMACLLGALRLQCKTSNLNYREFYYLLRMCY
jgi:hypothetical protein